jgi:hypothetical protein
MLTPVDIHPGLILRVISSHGLGAPVGSLAKVESVETSRSGDWVCHVRKLDKRPVNHRTRLYRSHLWASDLGRFEVVREATGRSGRTREGKRTAEQSGTTRIQLALPFPSEADYISSAFTTSS